MPTPLCEFFLGYPYDVLIVKKNSTVKIGERTYTVKEIEDMALLEQYFVYDFKDVLIVIKEPENHVIKVPKQHLRYINRIVLEKAMMWYRRELKINY